MAKRSAGLTVNLTPRYKMEDVARGNWRLALSWVNWLGGKDIFNADDFWGLVGMSYQIGTGSPVG